jgi:hypothetical protein
MNQNDIAYIAGLFDGEGTVDYAKRKEKRKTKSGSIKSYWCWKITMRIQMTDKYVLEWVADTLGVGTVRKRNRSPSRKPHWKDSWLWKCCHREALQVAKLLWPHLQVKLHKIEQIIDHYEVDDLDPPKSSAKIIYLNERKKTNVLSTIT